jgi:hypothetical protein
VDIPPLPITRPPKQITFKPILPPKPRLALTLCLNAITYNNPQRIKMVGTRKGTLQGKRNLLLFT